jgi:hypothetical protein
MNLEENILIFTILYIVLELYEVQWQKGENVLDMLGKMYKYYHKNIFLFLVMHPTFYFAIYLSMVTHYNLYAMTFFVIKGVDIATKMIFIKQVFIEEQIDDAMAQMLVIPLGKYFPYIGIMVYTPLIWMALQ